MEQTRARDDAGPPAEPGRRAPRAGGTRQLTTRGFACGVGVVLVVQLATCLYLLSHSYFFAEDISFLAEWKHVPVTPELLRTSIFGHLIPGFILVQKWFGSWFGADWRASSVVTLAVQLGGTVAFARLLLALVGRRTWWVIWLTAAFGLSVVVLNTAPWWGATWTMQITMVAAISAWGCTLRFANTGSWRHLASLAVMYTVSVAFFEKSIATSVYLGLFVLVVGTGPSEQWAARLRSALRLWPAWLVIAVITLADLAVYFSGPYLDQVGEPAGLGVQAEYLARSLPEGAFPTLVGAVYPESTIPGPDPLTVVVASAVCLGVVAWTSWRSSLARRAWLWYFVVILFSQALVARGRLGVFDVGTVVHNLRYQGDAVYLYVIALAVAVPAAVHGGPAVVRRRVTVLAALAPLLALPLWLQSVHAISVNSPGRVSRDYFAALRAEAPAAPILDLPVPGWVVPSQMYPRNMAHVVYPVVQPDATVTDGPDGALWVRPDGTIGPVQLADLVPPTTAEVCVRAGDPPTEILAASRDEVAQLPEPVLLALDYRASERASLRISVGRTAVQRDIRGPTGTPFHVDGRGALATVIAATHWHSVYLAGPTAGEVCVSRVRFARPQG